MKRANGMSVVSLDPAPLVAGAYIQAVLDALQLLDMRIVFRLNNKWCWVLDFMITRFAHK